MSKKSEFIYTDTDSIDTLYPTTMISPTYYSNKLHIKIVYNIGLYLCRWAFKRASKHYTKEMLNGIYGTKEKPNDNTHQ